MICDTKQRINTERSGGDRILLFPAGAAPSDDTISQQVKLIGKHGAVSSASMSTTRINLAKAFMGASTFELPWAFSKAGVVGSIVGIIGVAVMSNWCFVMLVELSHMCGINQPSYPQVGHVCMGRTGEILVWFGMAMMTIGVVGSYFLFIGEIVSDLVGSPAFPQWMAVLTAALLGATISLCRSLQSLSFTSVTGLVALGIAMLAVTHDAFTMCSIPAIDIWLETEPLWRLETYPLFLGGVNYLFLISTAILPIEQEMHPCDRASGGFKRAFTDAQMLVTAPNVIFAVVSWMAFSNSPQGLSGNILNSLTKGPVTNLVKGLMALNQMFTVPLFLVPMSNSFEHRILAKNEFGTTLGEMKRNLCRLGFALAAAAIALIVPNFGLLTGLTGAFGNNFLAFIFVPMLYFERHRCIGHWSDMCDSSGYKWSKVRQIAKLCILFVFGCCTLLLSGFATISALVSTSQ